MSDVSAAVRRRYAAAARRMSGPEARSDAECGCGGYAAHQLIQVGIQQSVSLGCGNPTLLAQLKPGETVLDLGSGGGLDVLLSARRVSPGGHAYGVDFTDEMLAVARRHQVDAGVENATFLKGSIESLPLDDGLVDVVISNCVINLSENKPQALHEAFRVLRPGGRLAIADMVALKDLPVEARTSTAWSECVAGAISPPTYRDLLLAAGFEDVSIEVHARHAVAGVSDALGSAYVRARKPAA